MTNRQHDIERYVRGEMSAGEMHAFEREALNDPFLSDALEGAQNTNPANFLYDLKDLKSSVAQRSGKRRPKIISMWNWSIGIAASLLLIAVSGVYLIGKMANEKRPMAQRENIDPSAYGLSANDTLEIIMPSVPTAIASAEVPEHVRRIERVAARGRVRREAEREVEVNLTDPATIQIQEESEEQSTVGATSAPLSLNPRVIKGTVISAEDGSALPGVNVVVKGTNMGTITDAEGKYSITLSQPDQKLEFNFIGLKSLVAETRNKTQVNVTLTPDYESLTEVVVTGAAINEAEHPTYNLAEPKGGRNAFSKYVEKKLIYPEQALKNEVEGRVTIQFTVDEEGRLGNFKVINSLGFGCDDEAIRLIREGPAWFPSKKNDKAVAEEVKVGLMFDIPDKKD